MPVCTPFPPDHTPGGLRYDHPDDYYTHDMRELMPIVVDPDPDTIQAWLDPDALKQKRLADLKREIQSR